jgi:hypothetical protein
MIAILGENILGKTFWKKHFGQNSSDKTFGTTRSGQNFSDKTFRTTRSGQNFTDKTFRTKLFGQNFSDKTFRTNFSDKTVEKWRRTRGRRKGKTNVLPTIYVCNQVYMLALLLMFICNQGDQIRVGTHFGCFFHNFVWSPCCPFLFISLAIGSDFYGKRRA